MNWKERQVGLINNDNNLSLKKKKKKMFLKLNERKTCKIQESPNETNFDHLIYYYKNMSRKRFNDFNNAIKLFQIKEDNDIKLKEAKNERIIRNFILQRGHRKNFEQI